MEPSSVAWEYYRLEPALLERTDSRLIFLQRVGGGYRFVHGALLEHMTRVGTR